MFFMQLEQRRVELLNADALKKERDSMVEVAISSLKRDGELREAWLRCFSVEEVDKSKVIVIILNIKSATP